MRREPLSAPTHSAMPQAAPGSFWFTAKKALLTPDKADVYFFSARIPAWRR